MPQSLDQVWADFYFELEATFAEIRQATSWLAHFEATDTGPKISTPTFDQCWITRNRRTDVICTMRWTSRSEGDNERIFQFRLEAAAARPVIRLEGETEISETTASAARYLLDTFRELATAERTEVAEETGPHGEAE